MLIRALAIVALSAPAIACAAMAWPPAPFADRTDLVEPMRRTAPVARCAGRDEQGCRVRSYCRWYRGYKQPDGSKVEAHCHMRDWYRRAHERKAWKE